MRLVHLTDPHLTTPPPWRSLVGRSHFGKRFLGYASWSRNRRHHLRREWLAELIEEVRARRPDQLLLTGDLTQIGTAEEIRQARDWLENAADPGEVCFVPGNHDAYAADSRALVSREWGAFLPAAGADGFPFVRRLQDVAIFGLNSAVPTVPFAATGRLGEAQLARLEASLGAHRDAFRVLVLHHPPLPGMIKPRKRLEDAPALAALLEREPVQLIAHGHRHRNQRSERLGARVYCTAPASAEAASFRCFEVEREAAGWQVTVELVQRQGGTFAVTDTERWSVSVPA